MTARPATAAAPPSSASAEDRGPVWAVVAHYGALAATRAALAALRAGERVPDRILVVDNQGDDDAASLEADELVRPAGNLGFAGAAAEGTRRALAAGAAWLWFVNNDAEVEHGCLAELLQAAAARPDAGLLSPLITRRDDGAVWFAGGAVDGRTLRVRHEVALRSVDEPYDTGYVTGCALLARAAAVRRLGPPDASLFLYFEDVEWSLRLRGAGWGVVIVPRARVAHDVARHEGRRTFSPTAVYYMTRNRLLLARRRAGLAPALLPALGWGGRQLAKTLSPTRRGAARATARALTGGLVDGVRGRTGPTDRRLEAGS